MTEHEWTTSRDAWAMLHVVERARPSERKVRLFNAAVCRRYWDYLPEASRQILIQSELRADDLVPRDPGNLELCCLANAAVAPLDRQYPDKCFPTRAARIQRDAAAAVCYAVLPNELWGAVGYLWDIDPAEKAVHADLIRDVFGNPFRPVALDPAWLAWDGGTVVKLADAIYSEPAFERVRLLADALAEAGCRDERVLRHCRGSGEHVRGCWLVDQVLGRT